MAYTAATTLTPNEILSLVKVRIILQIFEFEPDDSLNAEIEARVQAHLEDKFEKSQADMQELNVHIENEQAAITALESSIHELQAYIEELELAIEHGSNVIEERTAAALHTEKQVKKARAELDRITLTKDETHIDNASTILGYAAMRHNATQGKLIIAQRELEITEEELMLAQNELHRQQELLRAAHQNLKFYQDKLQVAKPIFEHDKSKLESAIAHEFAHDLRGGLDDTLKSRSINDIRAYYKNNLQEIRAYLAKGINYTSYTEEEIRTNLAETLDLLNTNSVDYAGKRKKDYYTPELVQAYLTGGYEAAKTIIDRAATESAVATVAHETAQTDTSTPLPGPDSSDSGETGFRDSDPSRLTHTTTRASTSTSPTFSLTSPEGGAAATVFRPAKPALTIITTPETTTGMG